MFLVLLQVLKSYLKLRFCYVTTPFSICFPNFNVFSCSGYMPPEYAVHGFFSIKSDVFSFGVVVLEIISGRKNRGFSDPQHHLNLLGHVSFEMYICL